MSEIIVGKIQDHDVIYIPEKDILFCKNTTMPYSVMRAALIESPVDRLELKSDLIMTQSDNGIIQLACLTTNIENIKEINKQIKKVKNGRRISKTED